MSSLSESYLFLDSRFDLDLLDPPAPGLDLLPPTPPLLSEVPEYCSEELNFPQPNFSLQK